jgi:pantetheine-phosphate adenylyltransferase
MAHMNHELAGVETFLIAADPVRAYISSTLVTVVPELPETTAPGASTRRGTADRP